MTFPPPHTHTACWVCVESLSSAFSVCLSGCVCVSTHSPPSITHFLSLHTLCHSPTHLYILCTVCVCVCVCITVCVCVCVHSFTHSHSTPHSVCVCVCVCLSHSTTLYTPFTFHLLSPPPTSTSTPHSLCVCVCVWAQGCALRPFPPSLLVSNV